LTTITRSLLLYRALVKDVLRQDGVRLPRPTRPARNTNEWWVLQSRLVEAQGEKDFRNRFEGEERMKNTQISSRLPRDRSFTVGRFRSSTIRVKSMTKPFVLSAPAWLASLSPRWRHYGPTDTRPLSARWAILGRVLAQRSVDDYKLAPTRKTVVKTGPMAAISPLLMRL